MPHLEPLKIKMTLHQVAGAPNDTTRAGADPSNNFVEDKDTLKDFIKDIDAAIKDDAAWVLSEDAVFVNIQRSTYCHPDCRLYSHCL